MHDISKEIGRVDCEDLLTPSFKNLLTDYDNTVISYNKFVRIMKRLYLKLKRKTLRKTSGKCCYWFSDKKHIHRAREMAKTYISNLVGFECDFRFMPSDEYFDSLNDCIIIERKK